MSKIAEALGRDMKKTSERHEAKKKEKIPSTHSFHVKEAHGGGFVVETRKEGGKDYDPGKTTIHKNTSSVKKHMDDCCGGASDKSEPE